MSITAFHATGADIKEFNLEWLNGGEHTFGVGIYFSTSKDKLSFYLEEEEKPKIYETEIQSENIVLWHHIIDVSIIKKLIDNSQYKQELLSQYGYEYYLKKYKNKNYLYFIKNFIHEIWELKDIEIKGTYYKEFLNQLAEINIDGMFMENGTFRNEIIVFNPSAITITKVFNIE